MTGDHVPVRKLISVSLFAIAFGFVESSIVVYLRALYYPEGFTMPLKIISDQHAMVELCREAATLVMLSAIGIVAGKKGWQRFGYFLVAFGVWDIFYYIWLKIILGWPASLTDWDILFLIPVPWIGPVIAAGPIALLMTISGVGIVVRTSLHEHFRPTLVSWVFAVAATGGILYSFLSDTGATLKGHMPLPYRYELLAIGLFLFCTSYVFACKQPAGKSPAA